MAKIKVENSFIWIIMAAIRIYGTNFLKFGSYMLFPVLGQVLGILLVFCLSGLFAAYLPDLQDKYPAFRDTTTVIISVIAITVPGLLIFMKAFWDYLVAYGALNSLTDGFLNTGRIYDYPAHNATITKRAIPYMGLWFLYAIFGLIAINPFFWIIGAVFFIYFILIFQVFSFEPGQSPAGCFRRSFELIKGNCIRTLLIMLVIGLFTHFIFVQGFSVIFDFTRVTQFFCTLFEETLVGYIPIDQINNTILMVNPSFNLITPTKAAEFIVYQLVAFLVIGFTLPLRSVAWALWYIALSEASGTGVVSKKGKKIVKKVSAQVLDRATRKYND